MVKYYKEQFYDAVDKKDDAYWYQVARFEHIDIDFIREFKDFLDIDFVCQNENLELTNEFIDEFVYSKQHWFEISRRQNLPLEFLVKWEDYIMWEVFCLFERERDEGTLALFADRIDWESVAEHQKISEGFISHFRDYLNPISLLYNHKIYIGYQKMVEQIKNNHMKEFRKIDKLYGDRLYNRVTSTLYYWKCTEFFNQLPEYNEYLDKVR